MRFYELVLIVKQESDLKRVVCSTVSNHTGSGSLRIVKEESWGSRKLEYPISGEKRGQYILLGLETGDVEVIKELEKKIRFTPDILRHMLLRTHEISQSPSPILANEEPLGWR